MRRQTRLGKTIATVSTLTRAGGPQSSDVWLKRRRRRPVTQEYQGTDAGPDAPGAERVVVRVRPTT